MGLGLFGAGATAAAGAGAAAGGLSTAAEIGLGLSAASAAVGAVGAINSANAQAESASYQAQVAANNEKLATQNAGLASAAGSAAVEQEGMKVKAEVGAIKAAQAASNIDVNSGSALDVRSSAAELGELDALTIRSSAEKQTYGYQTQAISFGGQQQLEQSEANQAPIAGAISATGSILGGAGSVASRYAQWQQAAGSPGSTSINGGGDNLAVF